MYKVVLMGAALNTGNMGVSALASSLIKLILQVRSDASISFFIGEKSSDPQFLDAPGGRININVINHRLSPKAGLKKNLIWIFFMACLQRIMPLRPVKKLLIRSNPVLNELWETQFIGDIRGGDSFSDIYGFNKFFWLVLPVIVVLLLGKKLVLLPQTYGPYKSFLSQRIAKYIFKRASRIISRDKEGVDLVRKMTNDNRAGTNISFCPDVAFALDASVPKEINIHPPLIHDSKISLIGLNVNGLLYNGGYTRDNMFGLNYDYKVFVLNLVKRLANNTENHIVLIPHTFGLTDRVNSDPAACRDIMVQLEDRQKDRVHMLLGEHNQFELKGVIGLCDFFIGSRMHACIAALSQGIPTIGVAYSRKFLGVFESVNCGDMVADARRLTSEEIINKILLDFSNRLNLKSRLSNMDDVKNKIKETFEIILHSEY